MVSNITINCLYHILFLILGKKSIAVKSIAVNLNANTNLDHISVKIANGNFTDRYFTKSERAWLGTDWVGVGVEIDSLFSSNMSNVYLGSGPLYSVPQDGVLTGVRFIPCNTNCFNLHVFRKPNDTVMDQILGNKINWNIEFYIIS